MIWIVLFFLALSTYLYCLLGGADFGIGVHELFVKSKRKRAHEDIVKEAMGPVWEANHMWLIIVVVILFVGFPKVYAEGSTHLHIPIMLMLIGIIMRGCAFSFRHYDSVEDGSRKYYSLIFSISSLLTPIMLGVIVGALTLGRIQTEPLGYYETYVNPWLNVFSFAVGLFVLSIFTFLAGVFMIGEQSIGAFRLNYIRRAKISHIVMVIMGGLVFLAAELSGLNLAEKFLKNHIALVAIFLATASHGWLWLLFNIKSAWRLRFLTGFQLLMVVVAWFAIMYPNALYYADGSALSLLEHAAPAKTLFMLSLALIIGSVIFLPLLTYLFVVFKRPVKK